MQDSKKDTDVYNGLLDLEGEGEGGMIWENGIVACILSCKNRIASLCPMQETRVRSLGQEYPLKKVMATHSSIFTWEVPQTEEPGGLQSMESQSWT